MKPRRTHLSNKGFVFEDGNEDNDLWVTTSGPEDNTADSPCIGSTWVPTDEERHAIASGANIELVVWGPGHPPVTLRICTYLLGKPRETPAR